MVNIYVNATFKIFKNKKKFIIFDVIIAQMFLFEMLNLLMCLHSATSQVDLTKCKNVTVFLAPSVVSHVMNK